MGHEKLKKPFRTGSAARRTPRRVFHRTIGVLRAGEYNLVRAMQLSEGGLQFQSEIQYAVDDVIVLSILIPGKAGLVCRGQVVYFRPLATAGQAASQVSGKTSYQYGVKFDILALQPKRLIRNYVSAKTQAEAEAEMLESEGEAASMTTGQFGRKLNV